MRKDSSTKRELLLEVESLRARLEEAEETLRAIRSGEIDAIVVSGPRGAQVLTLEGADQPYRIFVETMNVGTVTLLPGGTIVYSNSRFSEMVRTPLTQVIGASFARFLSPEQEHSFKSLLERSRNGGSKAELTLLAGAEILVPAQLSERPLEENPACGFCLVVTDLTDQKEAARVPSWLQSWSLPRTPSSSRHWKELS